MPRFSANLGFLWPERPLLARIEAAAAAGFEAVELHWPYDVPAEAVRATCAERGVRLLALNTPVGDAAAGEFGLAAVPGREADFAAAFDQAVRYTVAIGAGAIHVMAGVVEPGQRDAARETFRRNLARAVDAADAHGLTLLLEPINQRDKPNYFYDRVEEAAQLIAAVGSPRLRLMFDCYHVQVGQGDVLRRLEAHLPVIGHVQIAAAPSRAEPDEGELAYGAVFETLDALGYEGFVGCEYRPRGDTDAGLAWAQRLGVRLGPVSPSAAR
ncbi:MAG TPA: TIM barrel protein [Beijerinckiaceae bacterium]